MTPQEAIERLRKIPVRPKPDNALDMLAIIMAVKALEKQIPKKSVLAAMDGFKPEYAATLLCPTCSNQIVNVWSRADYKPKYCHYCGQALDWDG